MSSSEGSAPVQPTSSGTSSGMTAAPGTPPRGGAILVSKVLTYSDVSTEVARTGRIVLPRIQVQQCLPELLRLCQAEHALPALRAGGPVKLSVDLVVEDESGRTWVVLLKTWQNVVSGEHRPTFVLENTADFVRANRLTQGDTLAFCPHGPSMLLRTSLRADQLLPRQLKRAGGAAPGAAAAKRRAPAAPRAPPAAAWGEPPAGSRKRKAPGFYAELLPAGEPAYYAAAVAPAAPYQPCTAADAAQTLLDLHSALTPPSSQSEQRALSGDLDSDAPAAARPAKAPRGGSASPASRPLPPPPAMPLQQAAAPAAGQPVPSAFRPQSVLERAAALLAAQQQQQQQCYSEAALPSPPPLSAAAAALGSLPADALAQAQSWLAAILAQQEQERLWVEQYNRALLLQALQREQLLASAAAAQAEGQCA